MLGTVLGAGGTTVKKTQKLPCSIGLSREDTTSENNSSSFQNHLTSFAISCWGNHGARGDRARQPALAFGNHQAWKELQLHLKTGLILFSPTTPSPQLHRKPSPRPGVGSHEFHTKQPQPKPISAQGRIKQLVVWMAEGLSLRQWRVYVLEG